MSHKDSHKWADACPSLAGHHQCRSKTPVWPSGGERNGDRRKEAKAEPRPSFPGSNLCVCLWKPNGEWINRDKTTRSPLPSSRRAFSHPPSRFMPGWALLVAAAGYIPSGLTVNRDVELVGGKSQPRAPSIAMKICARRNKLLGKVIPRAIQQKVELMDDPMALSDVTSPKKCLAARQDGSPLLHHPWVVKQPPDKERMFRIVLPE